MATYELLKMALKLGRLSLIFTRRIVVPPEFP
jgi:hypothetical protein